MQILPPDDTVHWHPEPGIRVRVRSFSAFLKTLHDNHRFHEFASRRPARFSPHDFTHPFLSSEELERVNQFKSLKKQIEWMAGRSLVKEMVGAVTPKGTVISDITIEYREEGAPFLPRYPETQVSITHSGNYAAVALCCDHHRTMGLDLEAIGPVPEPGFMRLAFTPREREYMGSDPIKIFRSWTLKEAFLKYIQRGFNESLHQVEILDDVILYRDVKARVNLFSATLGPDYLISLVSRKLDRTAVRRP